MRLWLRLDGELAGALDQGGCYHDPVAVEKMLTISWPDIRMWFEHMPVKRPPRDASGFRLPTSISLADLESDPLEMMRTARFLLRCICSGRAEALSEALEG